jgi:beta-ribofuranosylaminobenzene 5'-phosphate synthase
MIRVAAASRLHFGLLSLPSAEEAASAGPIRYFGGVGLMISEPGLRLSAQPASAWCAEGPLAERVLCFARQVSETLRAEGKEPPRPQHFVVEKAAPQHAGLGTGTQLALATARTLTPNQEASAAELARWTGRGARSALGVHGFVGGGFLVEAGKTRLDALAPLVARLVFPEDWRIVLVLPARLQGLHGLNEADAFRRLAGQPAASVSTDRLCRLVLLGLLPALAEGDLPAFGESLYEFNRLVGEMFQAVQGGEYAHPGSVALVSFLRRLGVLGVGQSSWGPALFAVTANADQAADVVQRLRHEFGLGPDEVFFTAAANAGAHVSYPGAAASPL